MRGVVVVPRTVQVGRHSRQVARAVLAVVRPAHFDARDLGQRIGPVGGLQRPGEQITLAHRLWCQLGVDAAAAQEQQALHAGAPGAVNHIGLDDQVVANKFRREAVVGDDAAHLGSGQEHVVWLFRLKHLLRGVGVSQVQLGVGACDQVCIAFCPQPPDDGAADQAAVAGDVDARLQRQGHVCSHRIDRRRGLTRGGHRLESQPA